jgi:hypothetical protein
MEPVGPTLHSYADRLLHRGDAEAASLRYRESLEIGKAQGMRSSYAYCTGGLAAAARLLGDREAAARLWGLLERFEDEFGRIRTFERPYYAELVGDVSGDRMYLAARALPLEEAKRVLDAYVDSL